MSDDAGSTPRPSDVAMWHRLSGLPDNVTDDGEIVAGDASARLRSEKAVLRAAIERLRTARSPHEVRGLARLAASYLIAGDVETARRYVSRAHDLLAQEPASGAP
jgi:Flp pilus assembly protein TadD